MEQIPNSNENKEQVLEQALVVSRSIKDSFDDLIEKVKEIRKTNPAVDNSISKYGGMGMFTESFKFKAYLPGAVAGGAELLISNYGFYNLQKVLEANKDRNISLDEMKNLQQSFEDRKGEILAILSEDYANEDEAYKGIEKLHKELMIPVLNENPILA
jgi:hypothetical protein